MEHVNQSVQSLEEERRFYLSVKSNLIFNCFGFALPHFVIGIK